MHPGFPFTTKHTISGTNSSIDLVWQYTDRPVATMMRTDAEEQKVIHVDDYDPYRYELQYIVDSIQNNNAINSFPIESLLESATLTFEYREKLVKCLRE